MNPTQPDSLKTAALGYFRSHEGVISHMYLDVVGLVTIAIGLMLPKREAAGNLTLYVRGTNRQATYEEKCSEWDRIKKLPAAHVASWYMPHTTLDMHDEDITREFVKAVNGFIAGLRQRFKDFDEFPINARLGLLDMAYSLGVTGVIRNYPRFCAAVDQKNWTVCAQECARRNVSEERNLTLAKLFLSAEE